MLCVKQAKPFPKDNIFEWSKLKQFADDNFEFYEMVESFLNSYKQCGKRGNCSLQVISPFPKVFSEDLYCRHLKTRACLGKGYGVSMMPETRLVIP